MSIINNLFDIINKINIIISFNVFFFTMIIELEKRYPNSQFIFGQYFNWYNLLEYQMSYYVL